MNYESIPQALVFQGQLQVPSKFVFTAKAKDSGASAQVFGLFSDGTRSAITDDISLDAAGRYDAHIVESLFSIPVAYQYVITGIEHLIEIPSIVMVTRHNVPITDVYPDAALATAASPILKSRVINLVFQGKQQVLDKLVILHRNADATDEAGIIAVGLCYDSTTNSTLQLPLIGYADTVNAVYGSLSPITVLDDNSWYQVIGPSTVNGFSAGEVFFSGSDSISMSTGNEGVYPFLPQSLVADTSEMAACVKQCNMLPANAFFYYVHGCDKLRALYSVDMVTKIAAELPIGE